MMLDISNKCFLEITSEPAWYLRGEVKWRGIRDK